MLHRRAAEWFAGRDPALNAEHLERAADPGAPRAYLAAPRPQAAGYRYDSALHLVERGLPLPVETTDRVALACLKCDVLPDLAAMAAAGHAHQHAARRGRNMTVRAGSFTWSPERQ